MKNTINTIALTTVLVFLLVGIIKADKRNYVWTYQYQTMERGKWELEYYNTQSSPTLENMKGNTSIEQQLELEVGMTDRFDFSIYQVFTQSPGATMKYKGFKFRSRYRIGEKNLFFVDPLVYLEYKGVPDFSEHVLEAKLILAKDIGNFNFALNPVFEAEFKNETEVKLGYAFGASYNFSGLLSLGLEARGNKTGNYLGPAISHGYETLWIGLTPLFAIGKVDAGKPEVYIRMIVAFGK